LSATWQWGVSGGDLCNLTINTEAAAKYLNDELEKRTITASVLADYIKAAAEAVDIERSIKTTSMQGAGDAKTDGLCFGGTP